MSIDKARVRDTRTLCRSMLDHLPQARQPSTTIETVAGLAPSRLAPCTACGARGRVANGKPCAGCAPLTGSLDRAPHFGVKHGCTPCPGCDGMGWRRRRVSDASLDGYASVEVPQSFDPEKRGELLKAVRTSLAAERERPEMRDQAIRRTTRLLDLAERPESVRFAWEERWEAMCAQGSYAELVVAFEILRQRYPDDYSLIWQVEVMQTGIELSDGRQRYLNASMVRLASMMPERIRVPYFLRAAVRNDLKKESLWRGRMPAHARERLERDMQVRRLRYEDEWKLRRLGEHFALSMAQVKRIVAATAMGY